MNIAMFTDAHGLLEPVEAALDDMKKRGITDIYSLGDNIGDGPDSLAVIRLLQNSGVKNIAGNAEEYITLGLKPFASYIFKNDRYKSVLKTRSQLDEDAIRFIATFPHSYELVIGGKKIGLCHFGNDVRIDFNERSTWSYQRHFDFSATGKRYDSDASKQFEYTASPEQIEKIKELGTGKSALSSENRGFVSAYKDPMFPTGVPGVGKKLEVFADVFQGHVHFKLEDPTKNTNFHTLRAIGIAYRKDPINTASYVILSEYVDSETGEKGFDTEEILVEFDREKMVSKILKINGPNSRIAAFTSMSDDEKKGKLR